MEKTWPWLFVGELKLSRMSLGIARGHYSSAIIMLAQMELEAVCTKIAIRVLIIKGQYVVIYFSKLYMARKFLF